MSNLRTGCFVVLLACSCTLAAAAQPDAARITALADQYVAEVSRRFPLTYAAAGLPSPKRDILDINTPQDLAAWRSFVQRMQRESETIDADAVRGRPEWSTLALLKQSLDQDLANQVCRLELWNVKAFSWQFTLGQVAELQPVGDATSRAAILARYALLPQFVQQEIANLREGTRLGFAAPRTAVNVVIKQMDALLAEPLTKSVYFSPALRDSDATFRRTWSDTVETKIRPALARYRNFLHDEYLTKARTTAGIAANKDGEACYRALIKANTSIDADPKELYARAVAHVQKETTEALQAGRRYYGREFQNLHGLAAALRADPKNRFQSAADVRAFIEATMARGKSAVSRVVPKVELIDVELKPFSDASAATAPGGQYVPADADGSRAPIYYYRADHQNLTPAQLESTVLHEVWPGHHLQFLVTKAHSRRGGGHALSQLVFVPGIGEGWATYVESLSRELRIYQSDLGIIGSVMDSLTPTLVADIGMHVMGWSEDETFNYLLQHYPATPRERVQRFADITVEEPGFVVSYALGAMEIESLREQWRRDLGSRFDLRAFHQAIIEDGTLPFPALRAKLQALAKQAR